MMNATERNRATALPRSDCPERDFQASAHAALRRARGLGKSMHSSAFILLSASSMIHMCELWLKSSSRRTEFEFSDMPSFLASLTFDYPRARIFS